MYNNKQKNYFNSLDEKRKMMYKGYKFICDLYDTVPYIESNWEFLFNKHLDKILALVKAANFNEEELNELNKFYNFESEVKYQTILNTLNRVRVLDECKNLKEEKATYTSITNKGIEIYVDGFGTSISKSECEKYLNNFYTNFKEYNVPKINTNSSKEDIKYALNRMVEIERLPRKFKYNHHEIGFIHSYFIEQGHLNIMKSMELFLESHASYSFIYKYYLEFNAKRNNTDSQIKLGKYFNPEVLAFNDRDYYRYKWAKKAYKRGTVDSQLCLVNFYYSMNKWNTNKKARQLLVKVLKKAKTNKDKLKCYKIFLSHQKKINYKFREAFDFDEFEKAIKECTGERDWLHCLLILCLNYTIGYGVKKDMNKAKELFCYFSKHTIKEVENDEIFLSLCENFYHNEFNDRCKELNLQ